MSEEAVRQTRSQKRALVKDAPPPDADLSPAGSDSKKPKLDLPDTDPPQDHHQPDHDQDHDQDGPPKLSEPDSKPARDEVIQNPTRTEPDLDEQPEEAASEPNRLTAAGGSPPLALALPPPPLLPPPSQQPANEDDPADQDKNRNQKEAADSRAAEPGSSSSSDNNNSRLPERSDKERNDKVLVGGSSSSRVKAEAQVLDVRNRVVRPSEPQRGSGGGGGGAAGILATGGEVKATIKVEVQTGDQPMDMSASRGSVKKEKRPPSSDDDDCIMLSDNEDPPSPPMNGLSHFKELDTDLLMKSSPEERDSIIRQLKEELRLEEAKLVLLKKLRQSQTQKDALQKPSSGSAAPPPLIRGTITASKGSQQVASGGRSSGTVIPPPLVRGGQQISSKHGGPQIIMPPLVRGAQQILSLRQQQQQQLSGSGGSGSGSGPPPLLLAPRASVPAAQGQRGLVQSGLIRVGNTNMLVNISQASPTNLKSTSMTSQAGGGGGVTVVNINDSPAARQAAAKLALRKQLEKTLLEIPPPKPPAPELNFLPSAANNEFIYLVGLEDVVQNLLDTIGRAKTGLPPPKPVLKEPYTCSQCSTDFTCRWRKDKPKGGGGAAGGSSVVLCEDCMSSNLKKTLKAEHTNRLKAAFVKALQQEQEIEQRILQQAAASPVSSQVSHAGHGAHTTTTSSSSSSSSSSPSMKVEQLVAQQLKQAQAQAQARAASLQHHHHQQQQQQQHQHQHQQHQASRGQQQQSIARHHASSSSSSIKQSPQGQLSRGSISSAGVRGLPHSFSSSSQLQSAVAAAALVSRPGKQQHHAHHHLSSRPSAQSSKVTTVGGGQHQQHQQQQVNHNHGGGGGGGGGNIRGGSGGGGGSASASATAWRKQSNMNTGVAMGYVNPSLSVHKSSSTVDARQREYLLDMIPSRSLSQTANTWK